MASDLRSLKITPSSQPGSFPSPARSEPESLGLPADQIGIYHPFSVPPSTPITQHQPSFFPPSPMSPSWTPHMAQCATPMMPEVHQDQWMDHFSNQMQVSQSPVGWGHQMTYSTSSDMHRAATPLSAGHHTHRSSISSSTDAPAFSRDGSEPVIKVEAAQEWGYPYAYSSGLVPQQTLTVSPQNLSAVPMPNSSPGYERSALAHGSHMAGPAVGLGITASDDRIKMEPGIKLEHGSPRRPSTFRRHSAAPLTRKKKSSRGRSNSEEADKKTDFQCKQCHKYFQRNYNLQKHQNTHNPNRKKDHACPESGCAHKFDRRADMQRHVQSCHTRNKPYACNNCEASFDRKDTLQRHVNQGCPKRSTVARKVSASSEHFQMHHPDSLPIRHSRLELLHPHNASSPMIYGAEAYHHHMQHQ